MTNFGRSLLVSDSEVHQWVIDNTKFLGDVKFNERVHCLMNNITEPPMCPFSGEKRLFVNYFEGYQPTRLSKTKITPVNVAPLSAVDIDFLRNNHTSMGPTALKNKYPDLYWRVMEHTKTFGDASLSERVYCILANITERPKKPFKSFTVGYGKSQKYEFLHEEYLQYMAMVGSDSIDHGKKIKRFILRNRERNADLYDLPEDQVGIGFVVCPVLGIRTLNIRKQYIEGILLMSPEKFREKFPNALVHCAEHSRRIAASLAVEIEPGVTRHAKSVVKATVSRATVGEDGLTVNARKGIKTRETHMKLDENGLNGYQKIAIGRNTTILDNGLTVQHNALIKRFNKIITSGKTYRSASKISKEKLKYLVEFSVKNDLKHHFDEHEYGIKCEAGYFFYDLVIPAAKICVEYQSNAFHPNPFWCDEKWNAWSSLYTKETADEKWLYDRTKAKYLWEKRGFQTWFVWEDSADSDAETILNKLKTWYRGEYV